MPTNINLFDCFWHGDTNLRNCVLEWIQVANDIVDLLDLLLCEILVVGRDVSG